MLHSRSNSNTVPGSRSSEDSFFKSRVQTKLAIGQPGDRYEVEADNTADKVVSRLKEPKLSGAEKPVFFSPKPAVQSKKQETVQQQEEGGQDQEIQENLPAEQAGPLTESITPLVQTSLLLEEPVQEKCDNCEEEKQPQPVQAKCAECEAKEKEANTSGQPVQQKCDKCAAEEEKAVQHKKESSTNSGDISQQLSASKGGGSPMDKTTQSEMSSGFGADFSNVRVHTDSNAVQMNKSLGSHAFTNGNDVYFNSGKYNPSSDSGKHLLAHELTHTVQQGASGNAIQQKTNTPTIQLKSVTESVDTIIDALDGITSRWDSEEILAEFSANKNNPGAIAEILRELKNRGSDYAMTGTAMIDWLFYDLTAEDARTLRGILIAAKVPDVNRIVALEVENVLSGYTSEADSGYILGLLLPYSGEQLDDVLSHLETESELNESDTRDWLFDDLTSVHAEQLRVHFLNAGGLKAAFNYAAKFTANKIYNLISGYTSVSDSWSVVSNFERTPEHARDFVLFELDNLTGTEWGERGVADALMQDLSKSDYEKIQALSGLTLPVYDYEESWLEWGWNGFMKGVDWVSMVLQWGVCGLVGIVTGLISVIYDIVILIKDIGLVVWDILEAFCYLISGGSVGSQGWLNIKDFFTGLGQLWNAPGEVISKAWDELVLEGSLIEGPFEACKEAEFWVRKFVNALVNILLIFAAGYGAVKLGTSALKTIATVIKQSGFRKGLMELGSMVLKGSKVKLLGLGDDAVKVIKALQSPIETMTKVSSKLNKIRLAAEDVNYWKFLRRMAGQKVDDEIQFWSENKKFWKNVVQGKLEQQGDIDGRTSRLANDLENNQITDDSVEQAEQLARDAQQLDSEVDEILDNVTTGNTTPSITPIRAELAELTGIEASLFAAFSEAEVTDLLNILKKFSTKLSRDRLRALRNIIEASIGKGRRIDKIIEHIRYLSTLEAAELDAVLTKFGLVPPVTKGWRGKIKIENGNLDEGWIHIDARHVTGNHPDGPGDLFPAGTTRAELEAVAQDIVNKGNRLSAINKRMQTFTMRTKVHGESMRVKVTVDATDGRLITMFPHKSE